MEEQVAATKVGDSKCYVAVVLLAALFLSSLAAFPWLELGHEVSQVFAFHAIGSVIALYTLAYHFLSGQYLRVNWLDVAVGGYGAYAILRILTNPYLPWYSKHTLTIVLLLMSYFFFRNFLRHRIFLLGTLAALLVVALGQVAIGILQKASYLPAWHDTFRVSGTFFNPAPYAGFLASALPMALAVSFNNRGTLRYLAIAAVVGILLILPVTASRAAWLGAAVGLAILLSRRWAVMDRLKRKLRTLPARIIATVTMVLLAGGLLIVLFHIRPASALSRLLTWKVSTSIIRDHPLWGVGYDQFFARFGQYQANYFQQYPNDPLSSLAGQGEYAFNLFVEIAVEQGLVGLGLFLFMLAMALRMAFRSGDSLTVAAGASVVAILVFGFFSYPMSIVPIQINLFFYLALIASRPATVRWASSGIRYAVVPGVALLLILLSYYDVKRYQAYQRWKVAAGHKDLFNYQEAIPIYEEIRSPLRDNGKFLFQYGQTLSYDGKHQQAIEILEGAKQRTTDTYLYTTLGESYQALGQYQKAERAFWFAAHHNPYRFYPRYLLTQLYLETGQSDKALIVAREIVAMDVKVPSSQVEHIREEMQTLLKEHGDAPSQ